MHRMLRVLLVTLCAAALALAMPGVVGAAGEAVGGGVSAAEFVDTLWMYLAEGCTRDGFETWLTVVNLNDGTPLQGYPAPSGPAYWTLEVAYTTNEGVMATKAYDLPKQSRTTINVNAEIGAGYDVAFELRYTTNCPGNSGYNKGGVWVERPMYFSYTGRGGHAPWQGGHVNVAARVGRAGPLGATTKQYFAEGTTRQDSERHFDEWLCVLNPNDEPAHLTFNYMIEGEGLFVRTGTVEARHRSTFYVPDHVGLNRDVSLELVSDVGVVAERPMYFSYRSVNPARPGRSWCGGHVISGVREEIFIPDSSQPAKPIDAPRTFAFAPVSYVPGMGWADTWVCFQNPNETDVPVQLTFSTPAGLAYFIKWLPPQQRTTCYYPELLAEFGVTSSRDPGAFRVQPVKGYPHVILVERPLYMEFDRPATTGQTPSGGTVISGSTRAGAIYAEGYTGAGFNTWVAMNYFKDSDTWREYWEDSLADDDFGKWHQAVCYFPGRASERAGVVPKELQATGYAGHWYTYMWHVNSDFPNTDMSLHVDGGSYSERIMIFSYMGKWVGMHSCGEGCNVW